MHTCTTTLHSTVVTPKNQLKVKEGLNFPTPLHTYTPIQTYIRIMQICLNTLALNMGDCEDVLQEALDPPPAAQVSAAMRTLRGLGALESEKGSSKIRLTAMGYKLCQLHIEPRLGKMLIYASALRCLRPVLGIAAAR
jgi:HrpA-like RNA helicase